MATSASSSAAATLQNVAHAAEEFVDQLHPTEQGQEEQEEGDDVDKEKSMEARKKKLELLRKKMASVISATMHAAVAVLANQTYRDRQRRPIVRPSLRRAQRRRSPREKLQGWSGNASLRRRYDRRPTRRTVERTSSGRRTGNIRLRRTTNGRRSRRERHDGLISRSTVSLTAPPLARYPLVGA